MTVIIIIVVITTCNSSSQINGEEKNVQNLQKVAENRNKHQVS